MYKDTCLMPHKNPKDRFTFADVDIYGYSAYLYITHSNGNRLEIATRQDSILENVCFYFLFVYVIVLF